MENCVFTFADVSVGGINVSFYGISSLELFNFIQAFFSFILHLKVHLVAILRDMLMDESINFLVNHHLHVCPFRLL